MATTSGSNVRLGRLPPQTAGVTPANLGTLTSTLTFSDSLAVSAQTQVPLNASALVFTDSLAPNAPTQVALNPSALVFSDSLAPNVPTQIPLNASDLVFTDSLALTAGTVASTLFLSRHTRIQAPATAKTFVKGP